MTIIIDIRPEPTPEKLRQLRREILALLDRLGYRERKP